MTQQVKAIKQKDRNAWWYDPLFLCLRNARNHGIEFRRIMQLAIIEIDKLILFNVLHDHLYQPAIEGAFKGRWICFKTYLKMYFRIMGTIMLKICQPITVPNLDLEWFYWLFHWRQRLVQKQIHKPANTTKEKLTKQQAELIPEIRQTMEEVQKLAKGSEGIPSNLFYDVKGMASVAIVFSDFEGNIATKMVGKDTFKRFQIEFDVVQKYVQGLQSYDKSDIIKAYEFVDSKKPEFDMQREYHNLQIGYNQLNNPYGLRVPKPIMFWEGCNAYSMECCIGETARDFLDSATKLFNGIQDIGKTLHTELLLFTGSTFITSMTKRITNKDIADALKSCAKTYYMILRMNSIMKNLNRIIEKAAEKPKRGTQNFLVHTDPSLAGLEPL